MRWQRFCMKKLYFSARACNSNCNTFCKKTLSFQEHFPEETDGEKRETSKHRFLLKPYLKQSAWLSISLLILQTLLHH